MASCCAAAGPRSLGSGQFVHDEVPLLPVRTRDKKDNLTEFTELSAAIVKRRGQLVKALRKYPLEGKELRLWCRILARLMALQFILSPRSRNPMETRT